MGSIKNHQRLNGYETCESTDYGAIPVYTTPPAPAGYAKKIESLIAERDALKAKLAEQPAQQEPVAWRTKVMLKTTGYMWNYTEAKVKGPDGKDLVDYEPLYTSPQRTQVGLTDEEIEVIAARTLFPVDFARAIEAKLKEKNT